MSLRSKISAGLMAFLPMVTLAETFDSGGYLGGIATSFSSIIATLLPAFIGLVIIGFAYGLFLYVKSGSGEDKEKGKSIMIWGALAVVILLSIYGIAGLLQNITGANQGLNSGTAPVTVPLD